MVFIPQSWGYQELSRHSKESYFKASNCFKNWKWFKHSTHNKDEKEESLSDEIIKYYCWRMG
jgi:hypothetical protein